MPTYVFKNLETEEVWEEIMSIAKMQETKSDNIITVPQAPLIVSAVAIKDTTSDGWNETLSRVAEANPNTPLAERYGPKDSKTVKTQEIVKKHFGSKREVPGF